jgi:hypothetical protein
MLPKLRQNPAHDFIVCRHHTPGKRGYGRLRRAGPVGQIVPNESSCPPSYHDVQPSLLSMLARFVHHSFMFHYHVSSCECRLGQRALFTECSQSVPSLYPFVSSLFPRRSLLVPKVSNGVGWYDVYIALFLCYIERGVCWPKNGICELQPGFLRSGTSRLLCPALRWGCSGRSFRKLSTSSGWATARRRSVTALGRMAWTWVMTRSASICAARGGGSTTPVPRCKLRRTPPGKGPCNLRERRGWFE